MTYNMSSLRFYPACKAMLTLRPMRTIGQRIRKRREELRLSVPFLAKACGVNRQSVYQWEKDETTPTGPNLVRLAEALNISEAWITGVSRSENSHRQKARTVAVVGYVGAGAEVLPFDDHAKGSGFEQVEAPVHEGGDCVALRLRGDSMYPMRDGWLIFYRKDSDSVDDSCINQLCVVRVTDGPTLVKEVRRGSQPGLFTLISWNAPPREDVRLDWASRVIDIRPR